MNIEIILEGALSLIIINKNYIRRRLLLSLTIALDSIMNSIGTMLRCWTKR